MSSRAIYGKPGGGKSYLSVAWAIDGELLNGTRPIITNEKLIFEGIIEYLQGKGRPDIDVYSRIRLIEFHEVKDFWRFRTMNPENDHRPVTPEEIKGDEKNGIEPFRPSSEHYGSGGVFYLLSELHRHLNSRQWMKTGPLVLDYISMHRHYGDDVVWVSQAPMNVDAQWRSVTQDWTLVRNFGKEGFRGFRKGDYFEWKTFLEYDEKESLNPQESGKFKVDPNGIGKCYDTSDVGGKADKGKKKKGLHIWWLYGGIAAVLAAIAIAFMFVPNLVGRRMAANVEKKTELDRKKHLAAAQPAVVPRPLVGGAAISAPQPSPTPKLFRVVAVPLKFSPASSVIQALQGDGKVTTVGENLTLTGTADNTALIVSGDDPQTVVGIAELVRQYDRQCATVSVHCVIARREIVAGQKIGLFGFFEDVAHGDTRADLRELLSTVAVDLASGVSTMGGTFTARMALDAFVEFVATDSGYEVMSHPSLTMLSGRDATFASGREIPVPTTVRDASGSQTSVEYKQAEFQFKVRPTVLEDGRIHLEITQSNTDVLSTAVVAGSEVPTLSTQSLQSVVDLSDRQLVYLGGILVDGKSKANRGTPFLRKVPGLNLIFGRDDETTDRAELFIVVCAEVYRGGAVPVRVERAEAVQR